MNFLQAMPIKRRLTLYFLVFFCLPLLLFGSIWYNRSVSEIENNTITLTGQLIKQVSHQLDDYFQVIETDTVPLPGHPLLQQLIKVDLKDSYEKYQLNEQLKNDLLHKFTYSRKDVIGFSIKTRTGNNYGSVNLDTRLDDWSKIEELEGNYGIIGAFNRRDFPVVTVYRAVFDNVTYQKQGLITINFSIDQILKIVAPLTTNDSMNISVVDRSNRFLYHQDRTKIGTVIDDEWMHYLATTEKNYFTLKNNKQNMLMMYNQSLSTGLMIIAEVPRKSLTENFAQLRMATLGVGIIILLLAYLIFHQMMLQVKRLADDIHKVRIKEKEMEFKQQEAVMQAMQARINPHFLFNTLEIINSHAVIMRVKPISQIVLKLADMFRYSISDSYTPIPLRREMKHIENYISIQQERFEDLCVTIAIDELMLDQVLTFCLTVQPIIENAILHGYDKHKLSPGEIVVSGTALADYYSLKIRNGGIGIQQEKMDWYNAKFALPYSDQLSAGEHSSTSIGLLNVHSRLRLAFGASYGLYISYADEQMTEIEMRLPYRTTL